MPRGRPPTSSVRKHIAEILFVFGPLTAYDVHKHYIQVFAKTTRRNAYYQLKRGVELKEFKVDRIEDEQGQYSWGPVSRKIYYTLTVGVKPDFNKEVKEYYDQVQKQGEDEKK